MPKTMLTYTTINNLSERILKVQKDYIPLKRGETLRIGKITEDIARHCGVGTDAIDKVKLHINQPSLPLAMKIAEYFKCRPDEIFTLVPICCTHCKQEWDGDKYESTKRLICGSCAQAFKPSTS